ncbi:thiolase domain-containing protein [Papillibacter cinnamivorans]|uniref:Acetyl-CoA C-acetyltransferase n=1 Tax=Papillibacter cinnamivorans DSM 12816 TaxID=1122930 RepID=A0A1W2AIA3_9FIRM|nr:thiolase domain-containing protein [Papillibacter cinnamivorans]SMC60354.1 acetyl-CoA C-acetyltransferase [Papillibacter cinnamivorans DSM 12816]
MRTVSVIGVGETRMGRLADRSNHDLIREAGERAIADAGIDKREIQALYIGNFVGGYLCRQNHYGAMASEVLNLGSIPTVHTEGACASGGLAFRMGYLGILSGLYDIVLVGGVEKMTHRPTETVTTAVASAMDFELEAMKGMTFPANFAMIANRYFQEYRNVKREMALCAVNAHRNACLNPDAQMPKELELEKVLEASPIASPLSIFDCSLVTDGAAFAVLASGEIAGRLCKKRVVDVVGTGHAGDALTLYGKKSITSFAASREAARQAYGQARLGPGDIDFAEVHDCFTITQIINTEDLGFFPPGKGADAVAEGITALDGKKPVNPSGGLKAKGHPIGATGLSQIFEAVTQIRGEAGPRQVKKADVALTQNLGGTAATCVINIFRGRD